MEKLFSIQWELRLGVFDESYIQYSALPVARPWSFPTTFTALVEVRGNVMIANPPEKYRRS